jgi:hypothetical protein
MFVNANDLQKTFVFPVFVCILENIPKNILRCLARRKMKFKKKKKKRITHHSMTNPQPQITARKPKYSKMVNSLLALDMHENMT